METIQKSSNQQNQNFNIKHHNLELTVLKKLLNMKTIIQYPKLTLMTYEAIKPYVCIFDNDFLSFIDICTKYKLIDLSKAPPEESTIRQYCYSTNINRNHCLEFFLNLEHYKKKMLSLAKKSGANVGSSGVVPNNTAGGITQTSSSQSGSLKDILKRRQPLSSEELTFVFDFMLEVLKYAHTGNLQAMISLPR